MYKGKRKCCNSIFVVQKKNDKNLIEEKNSNLAE